jgi:DNA-damage-inducible protein D
MDQITKIAIFKGQKVRKTIHNNEWWFVVDDIVVALTDSSSPKDYINKMRRRDTELSKGYGQFVHTLPVETQGGKTEYELR